MMWKPKSKIFSDDFAHLGTILSTQDLQNLIFYGRDQKVDKSESPKQPKVPSLLFTISVWNMLNS